MGLTDPPVIGDPQEARAEAAADEVLRALAESRRRAILRLVAVQAPELTERDRNLEMIKHGR